MVTTAAPPTAEDSRTWIQKQREIHGPEAVPDELLEERQQGGALHQEQSLLEAAAGMLGAPAQFEVAGRTFELYEPTVGQIKRYLLPAAGKIAQQAAAAGNKRGTNEDIAALVSGTNEFQDLMLDCIVFTDGKDRPESMLEWMDSLPATKGIDLIGAFAEGINWLEIVGKARQLWGKLKGVTTAAPRHAR